jgi:hypothetical protein
MCYKIEIYFEKSIFYLHIFLEYLMHSGTSSNSSCRILERIIIMEVKGYSYDIYQYISIDIK